VQHSTLINRICVRDNIGSFFMDHFSSQFSSTHPILDNHLSELV